MDKINLYYLFIANVYILLMFASTAYCFYRLCIPFFDRDKKVWLAGLTYFVVMVGLYYMPMKIGNFLAYSIGVIAALLVMCLMDKKNIAQKGFLAITFFAVRWLGLSMVGYLYDLAYTPVGNIIKTLLDYNETEIWKVYLGIFIGMNMIKLVIGFFFIWILILIIQKTFTYKKDKMTIKEMTMLSIPSVSGMMGYAILLSYNHMFEIYNQHYWLWFFNNMISIVAIIVVIVLFQDLKQKTKEERKNFILSNQIMDIQVHIEELEHLYSGIRGLKHDIGNHVGIIENLLIKKDYVEAKKYLHTLKGRVNVLEYEAKTGNPITDVVIGERAKEAQRKKIIFKTDFTYPQDIKDKTIDTFDVSIILNNALTNAIEAASGTEEAFITIRSYRKNNAFMIEIRNSYKGDMVIDDETGFPLTWKEDKENHGLGLLNIEKVAEKYYGGTKFEYNGEVFSLSIMLMLA